MENNPIITRKIEELIELAGASNEKQTQCILTSLLGARYSGDTYIMSVNVSDFVKNILLPRVNARIESDTASNN